MVSRDPRVDAYIAQSADFARPILEHLRALIQKTCPDVEEGIKWSMPFFSHKGSVICMMAAFKQHCSFRFWLQQEVLGERAEADGMGQFGKLTSLQDLPPDRQLVTDLRKALALAETGAKLSRAKSASRPAPSVPDDLAARLAQSEHSKARKTWAGFGPGARREYVDWINEAKTDATRHKRLVTTLAWLTEGKKRNWKYAR